MAQKKRNQVKPGPQKWGPQKSVIMRINVEMKSGWIVSGEFSSKREMLTFIQVPANEVDKIALGEMLSKEIEGLYSVEVERDGGLKITLENRCIEKVTVK